MELSGVRVVAARTEDIDEATRAGIVEACIAATGKADEFSKLFTLYVPSGGRHVYALAGDMVVGHAVATTRWLHAGDATTGDWAIGRWRLRTAYIDGVNTHPAWQRRGVGSAVMRKIAEVIADHDIGCLSTEVRGFYEPLGWEQWRGPLAGLRDGEVIPTPDETGIFVLRLAATRDLDLDAPLTVEGTRRLW